ncbi:MAG TPA: carboxylating nicotinate-nucleotide diphosphorylase [Ruminiclostridium sp.]|jgi:nicotinate-nucleotide pyrophosphorylase (carboxylating)|uniref:Probable nicotinate-nucleotide pyrophosphorylase [carboxylating] n=1 Tax=Acetivibrio saccincola TaxID=1677857 RepID=A0A2K9EU78_9FIRM|nr:carboxylating nicotinate-nucleotide diphosphorylase [Acetivibrio saccincola]HAA43286.1 carboxylating nicotinate-nucleotide diphosphorylase [Ruminiclostridium sp.]AUG59090.1 putative nicotinate-nucleotide pyrophosphorylase [carboxylating] [Acetivibrio saccincola]NLW26953.1 carboxylating nicotinate-nucleotide diphosphorylase [Acetivibrio saccincola]PQQ65845.1 nicotinate-nucleotide diphosphorylase (carboxylating) [Acetivibrio saccincola]HOA97625.1 carboxylating nicotinate-nucleotide diphosphor
MLNAFEIDKIILAGLKEDMPFGDITTDNLIDEASQSEAVLIAKDTGVIAGIDIAKRVFEILDKNVVFEKKIVDGERVKSGDIIAEIKGNTRALLKGERTALNLLQHLSGIATKTMNLCDKIKGTKSKVVDTRKTTLGLRALEKYAVRVGGGNNHRFSLSDGVMIKDNHIKAAGGIKEAVKKIREKIPHTIKIEVETETLEQVKEALEAGADIIMLDNMGGDKIKKAVKIVSGKAVIEASGNVDSDSISAIAEAGVDIISVGSLTHSVSAFDISMKFK